VTEPRDFEAALEKRLRELLGPGYGISFRGPYPSTDVIVTSPVRPERELSFPLWDGSYAEPGSSDVEDAAVLIFAHVGEREQRL
jgi:hypothetical protein